MFVNCVVICVVNSAVLCTVCVYMCAVLLPPGVNPIAVNKYINISIKNSSNQATADSRLRSLYHRD